MDRVCQGSVGALGLGRHSPRSACDGADAANAPALGALAARGGGARASWRRGDTRAAAGVGVQVALCAVDAALQMTRARADYSTRAVRGAPLERHAVLLFNYCTDKI